MEKEINELKQTTLTNDDVPRLYDLADDNAYKILSIIPTQKEFQFNSFEFRLILRTRLLINETEPYQKCYSCWNHFHPPINSTQNFKNKANHPDGCKCQHIDALRHTAIKRIIKDMILKHIKTFQGGKLEHIINEPNLTITTANIILQQKIGISRMKEELTILLNKVNSNNQNQNQNQNQSHQSLPNQPKMMN